jgi:hypothetical protein
MKKILFLSAAIVTGTALFAQNPAISTKYSNEEIATHIQNYRNSREHDVIPAGALLQKFQQDFPNAYDVEWDTNDEIYEVEFDVKLHDFTAYYDKDGNLLMYKQKIKEKELPAIVKTGAEAKHPKYRFEEIEKIVKGTETFYKIEMEYQDLEVKMFISNEGKIISKKFDY